jgi:hypothetical protein
MLELQPENDTLRGDIAYKYSTLSDMSLDLLHYTSIDPSDRSGTQWNNLGVAYARSGIPAKAVMAYEHAIEMNETLAMSNLAHKHLAAGFVSAAKELCKKALGEPTYDDAVVKALTAATELPVEEDKKEAAILDEAREKQRFLRDLGKAALSRTGSALPNLFKGPDCELSTEVIGMKFRAQGSYEQEPVNKLVTVFGFGTAKDTYNVSYDGEVRGRTIVASVTRRKVGEEQPSGLLSLLGMSNSGLALMIIEEKRIRVMENPHSRVPRFYVLELSQPASLAEGKQVS